MFLGKARSDEMVGVYDREAFENLAREIQMENTDFIKKIKQDIEYNVDRNSDMERGIKNICMQYFERGVSVSP
jgi:hypothetical protein